MQNAYKIQTEQSEKARLHSQQYDLHKRAALKQIRQALQWMQRGKTMQF